MSNPTSNFGWQMPEATDLVTDLPADFEVFGQAVDTDFVDLLGGTTGQVLSKTSATDLDFTWINNDTGDITGVTAGTGISGGGTSGTVTVTNSMATAIDAKGDLIGGTGADAFSRLAVGANDTVLTADSAQATGLKWAAPAAATFVGVSVFNTSTQSIPDSTATFITFNSETYDTDGFHDTTTNTDRITIPAGKAGKYLLTAIVHWNSDSTGYRLADFQVNGSTNAGFVVNATNGTVTKGVLTQIRTLAVADYVQLRTSQTSGGSLVFNGTFNGSFTATYLGA